MSTTNGGNMATVQIDGSGDARLNALVNGFTNMNFEEMYQRLPDVLLELHKYRTGRSSAIAVALQFLESYSSAEDENDQEAMRWIQKLYDCGFVSIFNAMWSSFWSPNIFKEVEAIRLEKMSKSSEEKKTAPEDYRSYIQRQKEPADIKKLKNDALTYYDNMECLIDILWGASDASPEICVEYIKQGGIEALAAVLQREDFDVRDIDQSEFKHYTINGVLGILHNCFRWYRQEARDRLRRSNGVRSLMHYLHSASGLIRGASALILAYVVNEEDAQRQGTFAELIQLLVSKFNLSLNDLQHRHEGFLAEELLEALNMLAINDANKAVIMQQESALQSYVMALDKPLHDRELLSTVKGAWLLSFNQDMKERMLSSGILRSLDNIRRTHKNPLITKAASGAVWNLQQGIRPGGVKKEIVVEKEKVEKAAIANQENKDVKPNAAVAEVKPKAAEPEKPLLPVGAPRPMGPQPRHVLISFDVTCLSLATQLQQHLEKTGNRKFYVDTTKLTAPSIDPVLYAVEDATAVVVLYSERYRIAPSCRTELEYALRLGKVVVPVAAQANYQPEGWLAKAVNWHRAVELGEAQDSRGFTHATGQILRELDSKAQLQATHPMAPINYA